MKNKSKFKFIYIILVLLILGGGVKLLYAAEEVNVDVSDFDKVDTVPHAHKFDVKFTDLYHYEECSICHTYKKFGKDYNPNSATLEACRETHSKLGNGGSKLLCENGYFDKAYRDTCNCGWRDKPQVILHGRPYNYTKNGAFNPNINLGYMTMTGYRLNDIKQISYNEYVSLGLNTAIRTGGQRYDWYDHDGDGYGWVFCGGPIMSNGNVVGVLEHILGNSGTPGQYDTGFGRHQEFDELFTLVRYIDGNRTNPNRNGFLTWLKDTSKQYNDINNPNHKLYGIIPKYTYNVTDTQFNAIISELKGYYIGVASWGWASTRIHERDEHANAQLIYSVNHADSTRYCFDSSKDIKCTFNSGIATKCDICGNNYSGNEEYDGEFYMHCTEGVRIKPGETRRCAGHEITGREYTKSTGEKSNIYGKVYHTYKRVGNRVTMVVDKVEVDSTFNVEYPTTEYVTKYSDECIPRSWETAFRLYFRHKTLGIGRAVQNRYTYTLGDVTDPVEYGYNGVNTHNQYWSVTGNGCPTGTSVRATIKVTFDDFKGHTSEGQGYSFNQLYLTVYDQDQTTIIPQGNGASTVALQQVSGSDRLWQGIVNIKTEVNGTKYVYVQATDSTGNKSKKVPVAISYIDAQGPSITASVDTNDWSRVKKVTVTGRDEFNRVWIGYSNSTLKEVTTVNKVGTLIYKIMGDLDGSRNITFYTKDASGNVEYKTVTISKIDNTNPTIRNITASKVNSNNSHISLELLYDDRNTVKNTNGSGVRKIELSKTKDFSSEVATHTGTDMGSFDINGTGTYYFRATDGVGLTSDIKTVAVNSWLEKVTGNPIKHPTVGNKSEYDFIKDNESINFPTYVLQDIVKTVDKDGNITFDTYYRRNRYDIEYVGNRQTKGETYVQHIMWGQDFTVLDNRFERVYKYNLKAEDDSRLDGDTTQELEAEIEGGITQLVETWKFQNWYFDNKKDSNRLESRTYLPGEVIDTDDKHLTLKDGDVLVFSVQWDPGKVTLPNVKRIGSDFIGWFNKEQIIGSTVLEARMLGKNETLTLDDLERRHIQDYDSNKEFTLYAWYNKKPIFVNIYDGVFFEGQKVTYADLLELIGVWDYDDNYQELQLDNINSHFDNLIEIVDNDIKTDKEELDYLIEELKDSEDESLTDDIKELREHLKELFEERNEIQKARRKATQEVKVRILEPRIAKIEYGAKEDEDYYDPRFGYEEVDYHTSKMSSNGLYEAKTPEEAGISYTDELLNTSTDKIGLVRITYQVHDKGIWYTDWSALDNEDDGQYEGLGDDFEHSDTAGAQIFIPNSDITLEYTRVCEIDFNYNPLLNLQNVLEYSEFNFDKDLSKYLLSKQVLRDSEDLQDNIPWWSKKTGDVLHKDINEQTQKKLQDSIIISGISEITLNGTFEYEHPVEAAQFKLEYTSPEGDKNDENDTRVIKLDSGLYDKSNIVKEIGDFQGNNEAYGNVTKNDIWMNITSIGITYDGYDQFGKCASNKVTNDRKVDEHYKVNTDQRPIGYIPKYNSGFNVDESSVDYDLRIYQTPFERTVYLVLVNIDNDSSLAYARSKDKVRYINDKYLSKLKDSYWGTTGLEDITKIMDKAKFPGDDYSDYEGNYINKKGTDIRVNVKDYTE